MDIENYRNSNLPARERAQDLISKMSIEEKMAQVQCVFAMPEKWEAVKEICRYGIGEVSTLEVRRLKTKEEATDLQRKVQEMVMEQSPHHIPAIFHMEGLCGAFIQDATSFPSGIGRGSSWNPELEEKIGQIVARQENAVGFTHVLAPVLDVSRDSRMGRQGETYGEDPTLAAVLGTAYTRGIQSTSVDCPMGEKGHETKKTMRRYSEAVAKHFMGFHNSEGGIHGAESHTPPRLLQEVYGKPFQAAICKAELRGVMPCYCTFDGVPASADKILLTKILREEMGFDGLVVSDYSAIENIHNVKKMYESLTEAGLRAMEAGMDVEMPVPSGFNKELTEWFAEGKADIAVLDRAVMRVLETKFRMGLFENPFSLENPVLNEVFTIKTDQTVALQSARESMILLKNDGTLPIRKSVKKVAVIGPHADNARSFFGGYTHVSMMEAVHAVANSIAGIGEAASNQQRTVTYIPGTQIQSDETEEFDAVLRQIKPDCRSLLEELRQRMPDTEIAYAYGYPIAGNDRSHYREALEIIHSADICILTLGGKNGSCSVASMGEGVDGTNINLPECQEMFIKSAAKIGVPLIGVHFDGRPISSDAADRYLHAVIEAWNPSEMGARAVTDVIVGNYNPSGRLPVSVAFHAGQIPVYYNHINGSAWHQGASIGFLNYVDLPHTPRYYFGYGLSYTTFQYAHFTCSKKEVASDGFVQVSLDVTNTGSYEGTEIVQLYLRDCFASVARPEKELAGFARVTLQPDETKHISFTIYPSQIAYLNKEMQWVIEQGQMDILIGASCADIRYQETVQVTDTRHIAGRDRVFYSIGEVQ